MIVQHQVRREIRARLDHPLDPGWNRISGVQVEGPLVTVDPDRYFFRFENATWLVCDWDRVRTELLDRHETDDQALEQLVLRFVQTHGRSTADAELVLRTAEQVYAHLFRDAYLGQPGLEGITARDLEILRQMGVMMALNRVELTGAITNVGPAWFFAICAERVFDLTAADAERVDELYHGTFFNEQRRIESVKAHAALGGRLVHGCQSRANMTGGCVVPYGTDITAFSHQLRGFREEWIQATRAGES